MFSQGPCLQSHTSYAASVGAALCWMMVPWPWSFSIFCHHLAFLPEKNYIKEVNPKQLGRV